MRDRSLFFLMVPLFCSLVKESVTDETVFPFFDFSKPGGHNEFMGYGGQSSNMPKEWVESPSYGKNKGALLLKYDLSKTAYSYWFQSLWGRSEILNAKNFFGNLNEPPVELDRFDMYVYKCAGTAFRLQIKDSDSNRVYTKVKVDSDEWTKVSRYLDFRNPDIWDGPDTKTIDPTKLKEVAIVIEKGDGNQNEGSFYIDELAFVDSKSSSYALNPSASPNTLLAHLAKREFQYYIDWYNEENGLWRVRSDFEGMFASTTAGWGLSALAIGVRNKWISKEFAVKRVINTMTKLRDGQKKGSTAEEAAKQNGYKGFFYHFVQKDGNRLGTSTLSSVDTAITIMGVLHARQAFEDVSEIKSLADEIYHRVEWPFLLDDNEREKNNKLTFTMGWVPEICNGSDTVERPGVSGCFDTYTWDYTTDEVIMINLLAAASPTYPVDARSFYAWKRIKGTYKNETLMQTFFGSKFTYFFLHEWVDFSILGKDNHPDPDKRTDWFQNSVSAARADLMFVSEEYAKNPEKYPTYKPPMWGLSVSDAPGLREGCHAGGHYCNYGSLPSGHLKQDGTLQPYSTLGMVHIVPDIAIPAIQDMIMNTEVFRERFGVADAYNLKPEAPCDGPVGEPWYRRTKDTADLSPIILSVDNYLNGGKTQQEFMSYPGIWKVLCKVFPDRKSDQCI